MKVTGLIKKVGKVEVVSDKFKKREIWVEIDRESNYPQTLNIQVSQDKADKFNLQEGQEAELEINLRGRTWTGSDGVEKCFNTIECWKWETVGSITQAPTEQPQAPTEEDEDGLPF